MSFLRVLVVFLLSFILLCNNALANVAIGWQQTNIIRNGSTSTYIATLTTATGTYEGKAVMTATVAQVAKKVGNRIPPHQVVINAVIEILGEGIDWVMDPENNNIKIKPSTNLDTIIKGKGNCTYSELIQDTSITYKGTYNQMKTQACAKHGGDALNTNTWMWSSDKKYFHLVCKNGQGANLGIVCDIPDLNKTISYEEIAVQIMKKANSQTDVNSQVYVGEALDESVSQNEKVVEWEKTKRKVDTTKKCLPVNEANIRAVLAPSNELTVQPSVSLSKIYGLVQWIEKTGAIAIEPIKMYENTIIVDGNHRFIAMKLCSMEAPRISSNLGYGIRQTAYPVKNIKIDTINWSVQ